MGGLKNSSLHFLIPAEQIFAKTVQKIPFQLLDVILKLGQYPLVYLLALFLTALGVAIPVGFLILYF